MPKTLFVFMLFVIVTILATSRSSMAQDQPEDYCFELASTTYKLLNSALEREHLAYFKKPEHRDSQADLYKFTPKDFVGNPKTSLAEARANLDAALEQLQQAERKQCLSKKKVSAAIDKLSDAKKIDGFLHARLAGLGGSAVDMTAEAYSTFLGKAIELKKAVLKGLIESDFGGQ